MDSFTVSGSIARWMRTQGWEMKAVNSSNKELIPCTSDAEWHSRREEAAGSWGVLLTASENENVRVWPCVEDGSRDTNAQHTALTDFISLLIKSFPASHHDTCWFLPPLMGQWGYFTPFLPASSVFPSIYWKRNWLPMTHNFQKQHR